MKFTVTFVGLIFKLKKLRTMKSIIFFFIFIFSLVFNLNAQDNIGNTEKVEVIREFKFLFRYQNYYIGGQPTLEALQWLKNQGVIKIINLRSEKENSEYSEYAYDEKTYTQKLGFEYYSIPVDGSKDYFPEKLEAFASLMNNNEKILIHCLSAVRATNFFMAYLVKNKGYSINEAVEIGRNINFVFPLEKLLGTEVRME
jgi:protein tyrosine phosphatase (PTP) superfamily phosphohydrolase (DUF442 family)